MAVTPDIRVPQAEMLVTLRSTAPVIQVPQASFVVPYNIPTKHLHATQAAYELTFQRKPTAIRAVQAQMLVVYDGRVQTPNVRADVFTLDGHDFYMLRLGDQSTLIYDNSTQHWVEWGSDPFPFWRVNCATNWVGAQKIAYQNGGTDVVLGDDTWGLLYFLDPLQPYDDFPDELAAPDVQQVPFTRIVMAQTTVSGRNFVPCYAIFLDGDNYGITADFAPFIQLETSDDQGKSWLNHGVITIEPNTLDQNYVWTSLGQMQSPGRLFRVTDNGILTRIDSMEMNDD